MPLKKCGVQPELYSLNLRKKKYASYFVHLQVLATSLRIIQQLPKEIFINKIQWDAEKTSCNLNIFNL